MANRAKPRAAKKKAAKGRVPSRGTVATLPKQSKKKRAAWAQARYAADADGFEPK